MNVSEKSHQEASLETDKNCQNRRLVYLSLNSKQGSFSEARDKARLASPPPPPPPCPGGGGCTSVTQWCFFGPYLSLKSSTWATMVTSMTCLGLLQVPINVLVEMSVNPRHYT